MNRKRNICHSSDWPIIHAFIAIICKVYEGNIQLTMKFKAYNCVSSLEHVLDFITVQLVTKELSITKYLPTVKGNIKINMVREWINVWLTCAC